MTMINHDHNHEWKQAGVRSKPQNPSAVLVVYICAECDAFTEMTLSSTARVPPAAGTFAVEKEGYNDQR